VKKGLGGRRGNGSEVEEVEGDSLVVQPHLISFFLSHVNHLRKLGTSQTFVMLPTCPELVFMLKTVEVERSWKIPKPKYLK